MYVNAVSVYKMKKYKELLRIYCIFYIVQATQSVCPHDPNSPVVDLCGTDPYTAYSFYVQSAGMESGHSQCKCRLTSDEDANKVIFQPSSNITTETCEQYVLVIQGLPDKLTYAWCNNQGLFSAILNSADPWSIDVAKVSPSSPYRDPGHCLHVNSYKPVTIVCNYHNSSTPVTRPPPPTDQSTPGPRPTVNHQDTIIIGVCVGAVVILVIVVVIVWRKCVKAGQPAEKLRQGDGDVPVIKVNENSSPKTSLTNGTSGIESPRVLYLEPVPTSKVTRSNSNPDTWRHKIRQPPVHANLVNTSDGSHFKENSKEFRNHQLNTFKEGVLNSETLEKGGTIEAKHRYITQIAMLPPDDIRYPVLRSSSLGKQTRRAHLAEERQRRRERRRSGDRRSSVGRSKSLNGHLGAL